MRRRDPLANPYPLIRRVYAYAAYRLGDGPDAEDVTSEVFERALRYRQTYDESRGVPEQWLIGIARRCVDDALSARRGPAEELRETIAPVEVENDAVRKLGLAAAIETLDQRSRDLIAMRYGGDLTARQIAELLGTTTNAIEVALHRALKRLRETLAAPLASEASQRAGTDPAPGVSR